MILFEQLDVAVAELEQLGVDPHRHPGVGVTEQRDGAAGVDAADAEDRGEGAPQGVRREVCDRRVPVGLEDLVGALSHRAQDDVQDVVTAP